MTVPEHGRLGLGGRPAGVQQHGDGVVVLWRVQELHVRPLVEEGVEVAWAQHHGAGMTDQQGAQLLFAESVVDRDEGNARQSGSEQGDGIGELVGAQIHDGLTAPEAVGGGMGAVQQFGGGQRTAARRYHRPIMRPRPPSQGSW